MPVTLPPPGGGSDQGGPGPSVNVFLPPSHGEGISDMQCDVQHLSDGAPAQVIVDGLLCSIVKANSRSPNEYELVAAIERKISEVEIKKSWWKLFNYFCDAYDDVRKMKIKEK